MSDRVNLRQRVSTLDKSPQFDSYSKVIININDETQVSVGDDFGRTLEFDNPFGTQEMAAQILEKLRGFQYQPWNASGALLDPAAEIGDGISVKDVYGGMYTRTRTFSKLMTANISAPYDEEIDHEYKFETPTERKFKREVGDVRASLVIQSDRITAEVEQREADSAEFRSQLNIQATQIAAKVSQTGGNQASFGWSLLANEFGLYSGNTKVFWVNASGAHVKGEISATTGKIGGFTIGASAIYNNISTFGGTQSTGVYLGTNGIQLGQNFRVNTSGNVTANNMTLTGTLTVGGQNITAANLRQGAERANSGYQGWNNTTSTVNTNGQTWSTGAGYGFNFDSMKNGGGYAYPINASSFRYNGTQYTPRSMSFIDGNGNTRTINYLGVASE